MTISMQTHHWPAEGLTRVPYWVYSDAAIYEEEQERIFRGPTWNFLCLEAELPRPETYRRSNLGALHPGDPVNLERSLHPTSRLSGHIVRGVVEVTGELLSLTEEGDAIIARFRAPPDILRHTVVKGPITIDGVSLTVIAKDSDSLTVSLVPFTQEHTNLTRKKPGETVNLESDIIARYVDQLLSERT